MKTHRKCCVLQCNSVQNNCTLFQFPKKDATFTEWMKAVGKHINRRQAQNKHIYICELHFERSLLHSCNHTIISDGKETEIERRRLRLRQNAVPSIFSNDLSDDTVQGDEVQGYISPEHKKQKDMESGKCAVKRETDEGDGLMEPLFVPIKSEPGSEGSSEETLIEEESCEATEDSEDMDSIKYAMERETNEGQGLMDPLFVPIKTDPDFEGALEDSVMEENLETTENTEEMDDGKCVMKRDTGDAQELLEPLFVPIKIEPDLEGTSDEAMKEDKIEAEDSTIHMPRLPDDHSSVAEIYQKEIAPGIMGDSSKNNYVETDTAHAELFSQCLKQTEKSVQESCSAFAASSYCSENALGQKVWEPNGDQRNMSSEKYSGAAKVSISAEEKEKFFIRKRPRSSSRKASSERSGGQKKHRRPFCCGICGKSFNFKAHIERHERIHTGERPFQCPSCNNTCITYTHLLAHLKVHSEERPYKCSVCEKSFKTSSALGRHMRLHRGEKPYKCTVCGMAFSQSCHLTSHQRSHTHEKPYSCTVCGKDFSRKDNLAKHMRSH